MARNALAYLALTVVQLGFGGFFVVLRRFGKGTDTDALVFVFIRDFFATVFLMIVALIIERKILFPAKKDLAMFFAMGFVGMFLTRITFVFGVYFTSASVGTIIQPIVPVWAYLFAACTKIEPIPNIKKISGFVRVIGVILAIAGAVTMCLGKDEKRETTSSDSEQVLGYAALFVNTASCATYILLQKKYVFMVETSRWRKQPFNVVAWNYAFGYMFTFISNIYNMICRPEKFSSLQFDAIYALAYGCLVNSVLCFGLVAWANSKVRSTLVSSFWPLQTLTGVALAYVVLGEKLNTFQMVGGIVIIVGLIAVLWASSREQKEYEIEEAKNNEMHLLDERQNHSVSL